MDKEPEIKIAIFRSMQNVHDTWRCFEKSAEFECFQSYDWILTWCQTIGLKQQQNLRILLVNINGVESILLPLYLKKKALVRILRFLGDPLSDYNFPLMHPNVELPNALWLKILIKIAIAVPEADVMMLERMPDRFRGCSGDELAKSNNSNDVAFFHRIEGDFLDYENTLLSKSYRQDSQRQYRRLQQIGAVQFEQQVSQSLDRHALDLALDLKEEQLRAKHGKTFFDIQGVREFYQNLPLEFSKGKFAQHLSILKVGDDIVASHWGIKSDSKFYLLLPAYKGGEMAKYSPGRLLIYELIRNSYNLKLKEFDFTIGGEAYKKNWSTETRRLANVTRAFSHLGRLYVFSKTCKSQLRPFKNKIVSFVAKTRLRLVSR